MAQPSATGITAQAIIASENVSIGAIALQFLMLAFGHSIIAYWRHRLTHVVPVLWQFHKVHHSAVDMNVMTDFRHTPLELLLASAAAEFPPVPSSAFRSRKKPASANSPPKAPSADAH